MSRRGGTIAASRIRGANNNSPAFFIWGGGPAGPIGNPYDVGNGPQAAMTDAKLVEWATQRFVSGGGFARGSTLKFVTGNDSYPTDGSIPLTPETSHRSWYQQALKPLWGATANTRDWFQRSDELGLDTYLLIATRSAFDSPYAFNALWHDNTTWGASTVAGALTPTAGTVLADIVSFATAVSNVNAATSGTGFKGLFFDPETSGASPFSQPYTGMPGGQSEATTRGWVMLRALQIENIISTFWSGAELGMYYDRSTGSWDELQFYIANGGAYSDHIYDYTTYDTFAAGLAAGASKYTQFDASPFYRGAGYGTDAPDGGVTRWANAVSFNASRRYARQSFLLANATIAGAGSLTEAQKLASMRNTYRTPFLWLTAGGPPAVEGPVPTPAEAQIMLRETIRWANGGKFAVYEQSLSDDPTYGGSSTYTKDWNPYEAALQAECVAGVAATQTPTVTITVPTSSPTWSSAGATLTISGTATTDTAIWRVEVINETTATTTMATDTDVITDADYVPLNPAKKPRSSTLGRIQHRGDFSCVVTGNVGANTIRVNSYTLHGLVGSDTLIWTRTS